MTLTKARPLQRPGRRPRNTSCVPDVLLYDDPEFERHETGPHPESAERLRSIRNELKRTGLSSRVRAGATRLAVPHVIRGVVREPTATSCTDYAEFTTPELDLDELVWPRDQPGPAFDLPLTEIIDFLAAVGARMELDRNEHLQEALEASVACSALGPRILTQAYRGLAHIFDPESLWFQVDHEVGRLVGASGRVIPAASVPVTLTGERDHDERIEGQVQVQAAQGVRRIGIRPADPPTPPAAVAAIEAADLVVLGPGSLFTSVLAAAVLPTSATKRTVMPL